MPEVFWNTPDGPLATDVKEWLLNNWRWSDNYLEERLELLIGKAVAEIEDGWEANSPGMFVLADWETKSGKAETFIASIETYAL